MALAGRSLTPTSAGTIPLITIRPATDCDAFWKSFPSSLVAADVPLPNSSSRRLPSERSLPAFWLPLARPRGTHRRGDRLFQLLELHWLYQVHSETRCQALFHVPVHPKAADRDSAHRADPV